MMGNINIPCRMMRLNWEDGYNTYSVIIGKNNIMLEYKNIKYAIALAVQLFGLCGCEKSALVGYSGENTVGFWVHAVNHSLYGKNNEELPVDTVVLDLAITGEMEDRDRVVEGVFIADAPGTVEEKRSNTAVEGEHYRILGGMVKANEQYGKFKVEIINNDILEENELKLNLSIWPNKDFEPGLKENRNIVITWSRKIMKPATWHAMRFFFCADYSTQVYKVFMQATGLKEFYYYEGLVSEEEGYVMARNFGNIVRAYEEEHGTPMLHDDGPMKGMPIIPLH